MRTIEHMRQLMSDSTGYCWAGVVGIGDGGERKRDHYYRGRCISHCRTKLLATCWAYSIYRAELYSTSLDIYRTVRILGLENSALCSRGCCPLSLSGIPLSSPSVYGH